MQSKCWLLLPEQQSVIPIVTNMEAFSISSSVLFNALELTVVDSGGSFLILFGLILKKSILLYV